MRLTAAADSPTYFWDAIVDRGGDPNTLRVTIDGQPTDHCVDADDVEGWADVVDRDDDGTVRVKPEGGPMIKRVHGTIVFAWNPLPPAATQPRAL